MQSYAILAYLIASVCFIQGAARPVRSGNGAEGG